MGLGYPSALLRVWHLGFYVGSIQDQQQCQPVLRPWGLGVVRGAECTLQGIGFWGLGFGIVGLVVLVQDAGLYGVTL